VYLSNSRGPDSLADLVAELGDPAQAVTVEQAVGADLVILALPFLRVPELVDVVADWTGRVVVDATNQFAEYTPVYSGYVDLGEETGSEWGCPPSARCNDHQGVQRDVRQLLGG